MSFADVTSGNVVGYNGVALNAGGKNMVAPCFIKVGSGSEVHLSDVKIVGYENSATYLEEILEFTATFQIRNPNGSPKNTYAYTDGTDDCETWNGGKWFDYDTMEEITKGNDVIFNPGDGFWFNAPDLEDCEGFYLQSSGEVLVGSQAIELNAGSKCAVCNMLPVSTTLSQIEIQGYEDSETYLTEILEFTMTMQELNSNGSPKHTYAYTDGTDDCETWNGGKWLDYDTMEEITSENDVTIPAGTGFWATAPDLEDCEAFTFVVPACLTAPTAK